MTDDRTDPVPMYAISEVALDAIWASLNDREGDGSYEACGYISAARENGPIPDAGVLERYVRAAVLFDTATKQRDFLMAQVDSLLGRLAASHVASGLINMAGAQGFVQKEAMPINAVLQGMATVEEGAT